MPNELNELNTQEYSKGRDVAVIQKQLQPKIGAGTYIFIVVLFLLGIIPGLVFLFKYQKAKQELKQIEQSIQRDASQVDNYLEQRVVVLKNLVKLVERSVDVDTKVYTEIAALRSGINRNPQNLGADLNNLEKISNSVSGFALNVEKYPDLQSQQAIQDAIAQNSYLQREITAARDLYNDRVNKWNKTIYTWPTYITVAHRNQYTTRIPFAVSKEVKEQARETFF